MRERFAQQLRRLNDELLAMSSAAELAIAGAAEALTHDDMDAARHAIELESEMGARERDLENLCIKLLLEQQPVARDLRLISSVLKMITDLERISDQACNIAEIVMRMHGQSRIKPLEHLPQMASQAAAMVTGSINAYINKDSDAAEKVRAMDDSVDELFRVIKNELILMIQKDSQNGEQAIDLLMIAKYFERIGDHAQNLAEWVIYSLTGVHKGGDEQ